ncbi:N-succinylglutamate 5-semialdehyde dehydrogenase [Pantoea agglomerans]|uniref:N-succinylglutamate 5-semialdehyde dehydrogenase n=1 Tax=Enterobacter agglomerans TaxID=549 RepID=A0A379AGQ3_ENTAG|nr:N-succinylglutamate 5-semialdehyde dehydrogenase [Pantoea agglomerans]
MAGAKRPQPLRSPQPVRRRATHFQPGPDAPLAERQAIVEKFAAGLEAHKTALAETIARETGKPRWEALTEVGRDDQQNRLFR